MDQIDQEGAVGDALQYGQIALFVFFQDAAEEEHRSYGVDKARRTQLLQRVRRVFKRHPVHQDPAVEDRCID